MKRIYLYIPLLALALGSCNKVMDTKPLDTYTASDVWGSYSLAEGYLFNCYANVVGGYMTRWSDDILTKDMLNEPWGGSFESEKTGQIDKYTDEGWDNFDKIRAVNLALLNLRTTSFTAIEKNTLTGEAYFLRSAIYFLEAERFGGVQLVRNVLSPDSNFAIARSSLKDTYDFILSDLDSAASLLPATNDRGRATTGAAYALKMRVALQAGAFLNDDGYYQQVIQAGNKLFAEGQYSLDSYTNLFNEYSTAVTSPENIMVFDKLSTNTSYQNTPMQSLVPNSAETGGKLTPTAAALFPLAETFEGWQNFSPTQDLVDDYLVTDADGTEKTWDQTTYAKTGGNANAMMYLHRDLRFYASIAYDSTRYYGNTIYTRTSGNVSNVNSPIAGGCLSEGTSTAYIFRKYIYQDNKLWYSDPVNFCYSVLRLGEAYLNYAEASILLGDEATARAYITKTYQVHGGFTNTITATGTDLWTAYKRERNVEMILENGDRYWSLLRWGVQTMGGLKTGYENSGYVIPELNGPIHGVAITIDGRGYTLFSKNELNNLPLLFTPKRYFFPVPYAQIQANPLLTQNPGWN